MADKQTVNFEENSPYRVAWELAKEVAKQEGAIQNKAPLAKADPRSYWFDLYAQSRRIVMDGWDARTTINAAQAAVAAAAAAAAAAAQQGAAQPVVSQPVAAQSAAAQPGASQPGPPQRAAAQPTAARSA